jgi:hypothetical protein
MTFKVGTKKVFTQAEMALPLNEFKNSQYVDHLFKIFARTVEKQIEDQYKMREVFDGSDEGKTTTIRRPVTFDKV